MIVSQDAKCAQISPLLYRFIPYGTEMAKQLMELFLARQISEAPVSIDPPSLEWGIKIKSCEKMFIAAGLIILDTLVIEYY